MKFHLAEYVYTAKKITLVRTRPEIREMHVKGSKYVLIKNCKVYSVRTGNFVFLFFRNVYY